PLFRSELELVLNTIFNVGEASGRIPLEVCHRLRQKHKGPLQRKTEVRYAIPQARGDSISKFNFPVVATIDEMFSEFQWKREPLKFAEGGPFQYSWDQLLSLAEGLAAYENAKRAKAEVVPERPLLQKEWAQAVIGSRVARALELKLGSVI